MKTEGTVRGRNGGGLGPEAGVWVIAETSDLSTKFPRIVKGRQDHKAARSVLVALDVQR